MWQCRKVKILELGLEWAAFHNHKLYKWRQDLGVNQGQEVFLDKQFNKHNKINNNPLKGLDLAKQKQVHQFKVSLP